MNDNATPQPNPRYAWYVLTILVIVYVLNFVDRQIISILANDIKRDLDLTDADLGFLWHGIRRLLFAVRHSLGKLADGWSRTRLLTLGLSLWSVMTAVSGLAKNGAMLAGARGWRGIGEATASPSAYSLLSDWFPKESARRPLAIYSSGLYLGGGLSLLIGARSSSVGMPHFPRVLDRWDWPAGRRPS
ncbi:MAG: MFS transporter [Sphingomonadales bacterium]|nr:MFS transporter [Sphingomonadales bacterium]